MSLRSVEHEIDAALAATRTAATPVGTAIDDILVPLADVSRGGKRVRARFVLAAHRLYGNPHPQAAAQCAAAVEIFQTAALVHDDVLDAADTRRGQPTIHRALATRHAHHGGTGDSEHYGTASAILAGDLALMAAQRVLTQAAWDLAPAVARRVTALFADMSQLCTAGQYLDMRLAAQPLEALADQEADIRATMRSKTASYTTEFPLAMGAAVADAPEEAVAGMRALGVPLGIAFQLRDDVLGLVGSPAVTGKPAGDDVREGKRTLLVAHAWRHGDAAVHQALRATFGVPDAPPEDIAAAVEAIVGTGALEAVEDIIAVRVAQAHDAFDAVVHASHADAADVAHMRDLIELVTARSQ